MTIVAELHNGTQLHFPDGTPDEHVDAMVRRHLGLEQTGGMQVEPAALMAFLQAIGAQASGTTTARQMEKKKASEREEERFNIIHKRMVDDGNAKVGAINSTGQVFGSAIEKLMDPLAQIAENAMIGSEIVKAVDGLTETIMEVGKSIIAAIQAPKEIYTGEDGKPKGLRVTKHITMKDII